MRKKYSLLLLVVAVLLTGCTMTYLDEANLSIADAGSDRANSTFFDVRIDDTEQLGDGIAFIREDSQLQIRGLWGQPEEYFQVDIVLTETASGNYPLNTRTAEATISEVIGRDAIGQKWAAWGQDAYIRIDLDETTERVAGEFKFTALGRGPTFFVEGTFDVEAREGVAEWNCDFDSDEITDCWFIN